MKLQDTTRSELAELVAEVQEIYGEVLDRVCATDIAGSSAAELMKIHAAMIRIDSIGRDDLWVAEQVDRWADSLLFVATGDQRSLATRINSRTAFTSTIKFFGEMAA